MMQHGTTASAGQAYTHGILHALQAAVCLNALLQVRERFAVAETDDALASSHDRQGWGATNMSQNKRMTLATASRETCRWSSSQAFCVQCITLS